MILSGASENDFILPRRLLTIRTVAVENFMKLPGAYGLALSIRLTTSFRMLNLCQASKAVC
jgi:hypothetical protein